MSQQPDPWALIAALQQQNAQLATAVAQMTAATRPIGHDLTVAAGWEMYAEVMKSRDWWPSVASTMSGPLAHFAQRLILDLRPSDWTVWRDEIASARTGAKRKLSTNTTNTILQRFQALFNWLVVERRIANNPWSGVKRQKAPRRQTTVSPADRRELLAACCPALRAMVLVHVDTGMRASEVRLLRWSEIDERRRRVRLAPERTKTSMPRQPVLSERALEAMLALPRHPVYVFANPATGVPYSASWVWQNWTEATDAIGLQAAPGDGNVHLHDLRHTFMSRAVKLVGLRTAMNQSGHETVDSAMIYVHSSDADLEDLKRKIDAENAAELQAERCGQKYQTDA